MDMLFLLSGVACAVETVMLFMNKDFLIFMGNKNGTGLREEEFDLPRLYRAERWLFLIDAVTCFVLGLNLGNMLAEWICIALCLVTLVIHFNNFRSDLYKKRKRR